MLPHGKALLLFALAALAACSARPGATGGTGGGGGSGGGAGQGACPPADAATTVTPWEPGSRAFRESTSVWGLRDLLVEGFRLSVVDYDGDGWADLLVRRGGVRSDDFAAAVRNTWLLRNTGASRFEDVTEASGLLTRRGGGTTGRPGEVYAFADFDNDGDVDGYCGLDDVDPVAADGETSELLVNEGDGTFRLGRIVSAARGDGGLNRPAGASFVDYDRDGLLDLWIPRHEQQAVLLRGDVASRFTDVTAAAGLQTVDWMDDSGAWRLDDLDAGLAHARAWGAAACDLNGDGLPELLTPSYGRFPNHLWQALPIAGGAPGADVTFTNRSVASGYAYDTNLSWQDNEFARCYCETNPAAEDCAGVPPPAVVCSDNWNHDIDRRPFRLGGNSSLAYCADLDNDADLDLLTGEIRHWWAGSGADASEVLLNEGGPDPSFSRPGNAALGLAVPHSTADWDEGHMTAVAFDFDNDGWLDIYQGASDYPGNHGRLYHQGPPLTFTEVPIDLGIDHHRSHGVAVADFDHDGDLDVVVGHSLARCVSGADECYPTAQVRSFANVFGDRNHWLQLDLEGAAGSNRGAVGARVTVRSGVNDGAITQTREVTAGHGHYGAQDDHVLHFGLGGALSAEVTVRWPDRDGTTETFRVAADSRYGVVQGGARAFACAD